MVRRSLLSNLPLVLAGAAGAAFGGFPKNAMGQDGGTQPGDLAFGGQFADADTCAGCHSGSVMGDAGYLPFDSWAGTMMANSMRDPLFFAALGVANHDSPGSGTFCIRCHAPIAFVRGNATPSDGSAIEPPIAPSTSSLDVQGVACDTCHRARPSGAPGEPPYLVGNAQVVFDNDTDRGGPRPGCDLAACDDADPPCACSPAHGTQLEPAIGDSSLCGQCHQVSNPGKPLRDLTGAVIAPSFPLDTTYQEWEASAYAPGGADPRGCIDCHMPAREGEWPAAKIFGAPPRPHLREHLLRCDAAVPCLGAA